MQQHRRLRPKGGDQGHAVAVEVDGRLQDRLGLGVAQTRIQGPDVEPGVVGDGRQLVQGGVHRPLPRSTKAGAAPSAAR